MLRHFVTASIQRLKRALGKSWFYIFMGCLLFSVSAQAENTIKHRFSSQPQTSRIVFEFPQKIAFSSQLNESTEQLNLLISSEHANFSLLNKELAKTYSSLVSKVEYRPSTIENMHEIVLYLNNRPTVKVFELLPRASKGHRVVVDLLESKPSEIFEIVIDPAHGGVELGSVGPNNIFEKDLSLQIATQLQNRLQQLDNVNATLTRTEDTYMYPHKRSEFAESIAADMLVSLQIENIETMDDGSSDYVSAWYYENSGSKSSLAQFLVHAESEGILLGNVADVINESGQNDTSLARMKEQPNNNKLKRSKLLANILSKHVNAEFNQKEIQPQPLDLVVLAGRKVPSVVLNLSHSVYQEAQNQSNMPSEEKLYNSVVATINEYALLNNMQHVIVDTSTHTIKEGETLYKISKIHKTSVPKLVQMNKLSTHTIEVGQTLLVPNTTNTTDI